MDCMQNSFECKLLVKMKSTTIEELTYYFCFVKLNFDFYIVKFNEKCS